MKSFYPVMEHVYVAKLEGVDVCNVSSLGFKLAISPRGYRIAISSWKEILVWALNPNAFLDPTTTPEGPLPDDCAYLEGCGYLYYQANELHEEMVKLEPIRFQGTGVVFGLEFRSENELWGWTDMGLVKWQFGQGHGLEDVVGLE